MTISRCALAVITERGRSVVEPTLSVLDGDEEDFLERHVTELRSEIGAADGRGRFNEDGVLEADIAEAVAGTESAFLAVVARWVHQLAGSMQGVEELPRCVSSPLLSNPATAETYLRSSSSTPKLKQRNWKRCRAAGFASAFSRICFRDQETFRKASRGQTRGHLTQTWWS